MCAQRQLTPRYVTERLFTARAALYRGSLHGRTPNGHSVLVRFRGAGGNIGMEPVLLIVGAPSTPSCPHDISRQFSGLQATAYPFAHSDSPGLPGRFLRRRLPGQRPCQNRGRSHCASSHGQKIAHEVHGFQKGTLLVIGRRPWPHASRCWPAAAAENVLSSVEVDLRVAQVAR